MLVSKLLQALLKRETIMTWILKSHGSRCYSLRVPVKLCPFTNFVWAGSESSLQLVKPHQHINHFFCEVVKGRELQHF